VVQVKERDGPKGTQVKHSERMLSRSQKKHCFCRYFLC